MTAEPPAYDRNVYGSPYGYFLALLAAGVSIAAADALRSEAAVADFFEARRERMATGSRREADRLRAPVA